MLKEKDIKIALIDYLLKSKYMKSDDSAVIINELVLGSRGRRADLALANGKLHAFEIKSDADTLTRLSGQVDAYGQCFDKVTLVATKKHLSEALLSVPDNVEVILVDKVKGRVSFKIKRRGRMDLVTEKSCLAEFLPVSVLVRILRKNRIACHKGISRLRALELLERLPVSVVRESTLGFLKHRYKDSFDNFISRRSEVRFSEQLELLSNWGEQPRNPEKPKVEPRRNMIRLKCTGENGARSEELYVTPRPGVLNNIRRSY